MMIAVQDQTGVIPNVIFLDEALDGLDDNLKTKAFGLLQKISLRHEATFVVEHNSQLKSMFTNTYNVTLKNGFSEIEKS
jgi:ABC-type molybdenum transport system ATPase subunit/photorepair protein PhrA